MALNKREKLIAWTLGVAVVLFVGDYYGVEPYIQNLKDIGTQQQTANTARSPRPRDSSTTTKKSAKCGKH